MEIKRSCGGGESYVDERLRICKAILKHYSFDVLIYELHDHKGQLNVYWKITPDKYQIEKLNDIWAVFNEKYIVHHICSSNVYKEFS